MENSFFISHFYHTKDPFLTRHFYETEKPIYLRFFPSAQISWYRNSMLIEQTERVTVEIRRDVTTYRTCLTVRDVTLADAGEYQIVARNDYGESNVKVSLVVKGERRWRRVEFCGARFARVYSVFRSKMSAKVAAKMAAKIITDGYSRQMRKRC